MTEAEPVAENGAAEVPVVQAPVEIPESASPAENPVSEKSIAERAAEDDAEEAAPVAVRNNETPAATPAEPIAVENSAGNGMTPAEAIAAPLEGPAPQAVRASSHETQPQGAESKESPQGTYGKKVVYERVYIGPDGIPVRAIYVAEESPSAGHTLDDDPFPLKFRLGASASVNSYYLSNDENQYDGWYESFNGFSWRAGVVALIPLSKPSIGLKVGVFYEQSSASENYYVNEVSTQFTFEQKKIDVPVLLTFKAFGSRLMFDLGPQVSIPLEDELKVSFRNPDTKKKVKSGMDLMDEYRNSLDWSLVLGFSIMANSVLSLDLRAELGLSEIYDGTMDYLDLGLSSSSFGVGFTVYPF